MDDAAARLASLAHAARDELEGDLLPFWYRLTDREHGGHFASMTHDGSLDPRGAKSTVFTARLLWTMAEAWRVLGDATALAQAEHAKRFLLDRLADREEGGFFWSAAHDGHPLDAGKHVYAQAFAIYGLSAFAAATGDGEARDAALATFRLLEARARAAHGYGEAFDRAWRPIGNARFRAGGVIGPRTMNTHLHLLEAYTVLAAIAGEDGPRRALGDLHRLVLDRFIEPRGRFAYSVLDERLESLGGPILMGHDIETAWLLDASADTLGDPALRAETRAAAARLACFAAKAGWRGEAGFLAERHGLLSLRRRWRIWWAQAEAVVGFVNEFQRAGDIEALGRAEAVWRYIGRHVRDRAGGEWFWRVDARGRPDPAMPKVSPWKEPYHQARACLELMRRAGLGR